MKRWMIVCAALALLLALCTGVFADGPNYETITNYEELTQACQIGGTYLVDPAADFGWPSEPTELSVFLTLYLIGDWTIPEQMTMDLHGEIQDDRYTGVHDQKLTVNGTLKLSGTDAIHVNQLDIGGTLLLEKDNTILHADEGILRETGVIRFADPSWNCNLELGYGPHAQLAPAAPCTHWVFCEGAQLLGKESGSARGNLIVDRMATNGVSYGAKLEALGEVRTDFMLELFTSELELGGSWTFAGIDARGDSLLQVLGQTSTRYLSLFHDDPVSDGETLIRVPAEALLAVEQWEEQPQYGSSVAVTGRARLQIDGTLRLGVSTRMTDALHIVGNGLIRPLARYEDGTGQPYFYTPENEQFNFSDIILDRGAYADCVATSLTIERDWKIIPRIETQPADLTVQAGQTAEFRVQAKYAQSYEWMYHDGQRYKAIPAEMGSGADTPTLRVNAKAAYNGYGFRCTVTGPDGRRTTQTATLSVEGAAESPFTDVQPGAYYFDAVLWAAGHEPQITSGTTASTFSPNATCTRAQVVTFLWRANGCPEAAGGAETQNPFTDVKADAYYAKAVAWAVESGISSGTGKTTFSPNTGCTRAQVVTFLWRAEGEPEPGSANNPFQDVSGGYYYKAVLWAVENGITSGTSPTKFSPNATCTRAQVVTFLYRDLAD